jgi:hypothetical protein
MFNIRVVNVKQSHEEHVLKETVLTMCLQSRNMKVLTGNIQNLYYKRNGHQNPLYMN